MKILVTGSRHYADLEKVKATLALFAPDIVVHGRALGADACAHFACEELGHIEVRPYPADWVQHGMAAGPIRNQQMIDTEQQKREPIDLCLAFPMPDSKGTWDCVEKALIANIDVEVVSDDKKDGERLAALKRTHGTGRRLTGGARGGKKANATLRKR